MGNMSVMKMLMGAVIIAALVALLYVALGQFGIGIPAWVITVFWILVVTFVILGAMKLVYSWWSSIP